MRRRSWDWDLGLRQLGSECCSTKLSRTRGAV